MKLCLVFQLAAYSKDVGRAAMEMVVTLSHITKQGTCESVGGFFYATSYESSIEPGRTWLGSG